MEPQAGVVVLVAAAGDEGMTIGNVNSQAGVFKTRCSALATKHLDRGSIE